MANLNDFAARFRHGLSSANPFKTFGTEWCPRCRMEVDCDTEAHHEGTVYGYKRSCRRCGRVIMRGLFNNVPLLSNVPLPPAALEWSLKPGQDRSPRLYSEKE